MFNISSLSDDMITRVDEAIKELSINKLQIQTDTTSGLQSFRSPIRDEFLHQALSTKQQNNNKKSSSNIIQSY